MIDFHEFLRKRRSVRRFTSDPVGIEVLERILTTATYAPSAHNRQPWRFAVITESLQKSQMSSAMALDFKRDLTADNLAPEEIENRLKRSVDRINEAPVVIVLSMDASEMDVYPDAQRSEAERVMAIQSVAAAGFALQLAAQAEGLGSVWTCSPLFAPDTLKRALSLPTGWEPQAMYFLGYAAQPPKEKALKKLEDVVKFL